MSSDTTGPLQVPFFRPSLGEAEIAEVVSCLRSGWLTTGPVARRFEMAFAAAVGGKFAVAVNSCTAALHLALEALDLKPGDGVLVPALTFAATAEVVRYLGGIPILVDCDPVSGNLDLADAADKLAALRAGKLPPAVLLCKRVVGIIPVHVSGWMVDMDAVNVFAAEHQLWVVEDAAHAFPAAWRPHDDAPWQHCGAGGSSVACFSFYANKTITTGEGGMAITNSEVLANRMRMMSLHGLSHDAWGRYSGGSWDYRIVAPGYKYNLTDLAAAIGVRQLERAEAMRQSRERLAQNYAAALGDCPALELPPSPHNRLHAWHLYPVRLRLDRLGIDRGAFMDQLKQRGVGCSVHWRPLHLHPYYEQTFGWRPEDLKVASQLWPRLVSLPLFPDMTADDQAHVVRTVRAIVSEFGR